MLASWFDSLWRDLCHAARTSRRTPGFTAAVILVLAIGIGGTTLVFSIVEALMLRPLPYAEPEKLLVVTERGWAWPFAVPSAPWGMVAELRQASGVFKEAGACAQRAANLSWPTEGERVRVARITTGFLPVLGVQPAIGRRFDEDDARGTRGNVAILSDALWRRRYAASGDAIGRTLTLDDQRYTVVGVLPPNFGMLNELTPAAGVSYDAHVDVLVPWSGLSLMFEQPTRTGNEWAPAVFARLRDGASLEEARRTIGALAERVPTGSTEALTFGLAPVAEIVDEGVRPQMVRLVTAVLMLLLVACANVANLLLERAEGHRRDLAIRAALGASAGRLLQAVVAHALLLAVAGGAAGVLLAVAALRVVQFVAGQMVTRLDLLAIDLRVLACAAGMSVVTGLAVSAIPAIRTARTGVSASLGATAATTGRRRLPVPSLLVVVEVALSLMLVVVGALLAGDLRRMLAIDRGFRTDGVLTAEVSLSRTRYPGDEAYEFFNKLVQKASAVPDVRRAALAEAYPGSESFHARTGTVEGGGRSEMIPVRVVSGNYFSALSIPIVAGRSLRESDEETAPRVGVADESFAYKYWGGAREALGKQVTFGEETITVVGVAANTRLGGTPRFEPPLLYLSYWQFARQHPSREPRQATLLLRARRGDGAALAGPLRQLMREIDPYQPLYNVITLERIVSAWQARPRLVLAMVAVFGALTLVLAAIGVHAVMAYAVALRRREIGVRLALGAMPGRMLCLVVGRSLKLVLEGILVSLPVTVGFVWFSSSEFFAVSGVDPTVCAAAVALVIAAGLGAALVPAARAMRIDPIEELRSE